MIITFFALQNLFIPFMSISGYGFTSISSAAVVDKPATLPAIVSFWNGFGMVTLNQTKKRNKNHLNTPHKPLVPLFTVLLFIQRCSLIQLKAWLCKELCQDSQRQEWMARTQRVLKAALLLKLNLVSEHNDFSCSPTDTCNNTACVHSCNEAKELIWESLR